MDSEKMDSEKPKDTLWDYLLGIIALFIGGAFIYLSFNYKYSILDDLIAIFSLISFTLYLFVPTEMTYLMFTGMVGIWTLSFTFYWIPKNNTFLFFLFPFWLLLGYLIYKYLDFRKTSAAEKKTYEEEPHKEVLKEVIAAIIDKLDTGKGISYYSVVETAMKTGINQESVEAGIKELMDEGRCYEPKIGILRKV